MVQTCMSICSGAATEQSCTVEMKCMGMAENQHSDITLIERESRVVERDLPHIRLVQQSKCLELGQR